MNKGLNIPKWRVYKARNNNGKVKPFALPSATNCPSGSVMPHPLPESIDLMPVVGQKILTSETDDELPVTYPLEILEEIKRAWIRDAFEELKAWFEGQFKKELIFRVEEEVERQNEFWATKRANTPEDILRVPEDLREFIEEKCRREITFRVGEELERQKIAMDDMEKRIAAQSEGVEQKVKAWISGASEKLVTSFCTIRF